jgi:hypothetical protein
LELVFVHSIAKLQGKPTNQSAVGVFIDSKHDLFVVFIIASFLSLRKGRHSNEGKNQNENGFQKMGHSLLTISNAEEGTLFKSNIKVNLYGIDKKFAQGFTGVETVLSQ